MVKNLGLLVLTAAFALASEAHKVTFYQPATVNGTAFKAGEVKVEVKDATTVILKQGKTTAEAKAKVEQSSDKFLNSSVSVDGDTKQLQEIRIGGTATKVLFETGKSGVAAGNE